MDFDSIEFVITNIGKEGLRYASLIDFAPDSQITTLTEDMFLHSLVSHLSIPRSIQTIDEKVFINHLK